MAFYYGVMSKSIKSVLLLSLLLLCASISPCPALITSVLLLSRHSHVYCMRIHLVMNSYLWSSPCCRWQSTRPPLAMSRVHLFLLHRLLLLLLAAPSQKSRHFITEQQMKSGGRAMKKKSIRDTRCDSKHVLSLYAHRLVKIHILSLSDMAVCMWTPFVCLSILQYQLTNYYWGRNK